jgi:hypothetical protein
MIEPIVRKRWTIAEATSPPGPTAPSPQFTSHETACILNASEEEAHDDITIYSSCIVGRQEQLSRPRGPRLTLSLRQVHLGPVDALAMEEHPSVTLC